MKILSNEEWRNLDYLSLIKLRQDRLKKITADKGLFLASKVYYKQNFSDFISDWMWTYDPRTLPATKPFILFPKQIEYIEWLDERRKQKEDGLADKSRDMGITWLNCSYSVCLWIFIDSQKIGFGSRKEMLVDRMGDPDSIFEKIRILLRLLPEIFLPIFYNSRNEIQRFDDKRDAGYLKIINRQNGSTITGEAGDEIGRGGRSTIYFKDESAFYARPDRVESALSENSDVKIDVSTPNGTGNPFYRKRFSGEIPTITLNWRDHPLKDEAWYEKRRRVLDPQVLAQEIDIDYEASVEGICIEAKWVNAAINAHLVIEEWKNEGITGPRQAGLDLAGTIGKTGAESVIVRGQGNVATDVCAFKLDSATKALMKAISICEDSSIKKLKYDADGIGGDVQENYAMIRKSKTNKIELIPIRSGSTKLLGVWIEGIDGDKPIMNADHFLNYRAQMWYDARKRFFKTYEYVVLGLKHPIDALISIPFDVKLIEQLSQPKVEPALNGKLKIESKQDMRKRGLKSPDRADALVYFISQRLSSVVRVFR